MVRSALAQRGSAMGRGPRAGADYVPAISVVIGSMVSLLPIVSSTGWWPDWGLLMLVAWRLLRADAWPAWWAAPLGFANDLILGNPIGLSVAHFSELCRATLRMPPYKYLIRRRMLRALELLKAGNHRIVEVAMAVGFRDQGHFSATFRELFACTPRSVMLHGRIIPEESPNKP